MSRSWFHSQLSQSTSPLRPPPPILASVAAIAPPDISTRKTHSPLTAILRQAKALEENLQALLDAQADGLLSHLNGAASGPEADTTNAAASTTLSGSYTTAQTSSGRLLSGSKVLPVRQPEVRPLSLRHARKAIWDTMRQLSTLKADEADVLIDGIAEDDDRLARIHAWVKKREGLEEGMASVRENSNSSRVDELRKEDSGLSQEIERLEVQLQELKSQQRAVKHELQTVENGVQARLSSYKESARLLEREIGSFLKNPRPALPGLSEVDGLDNIPQDQESYMDLPASRRTLDMARESVENEKTTAQARLERVSSEREALVDGASLWNDVVADIDGFERLLKKHIRSLSRSDGSGASESDRDTVLKSMDEVLESVQTKLALAETKAWNLLVVSIGAEVDAFSQGRDLLRAALLGEGDAAEREHDTNQSNGSQDTHDTAPEDRKLGEEVESTGEPEHPSPVLRSAVLDPPSLKAHDEQVHSDDEPDPELLISQ